MKHKTHRAGEQEKQREKEKQWLTEELVNPLGSMLPLAFFFTILAVVMQLELGSPRV